MSAKAHFFKGDHKEFLKQVDSLDFCDSSADWELFSFKIGALCFLGRTEEAEILFESRRAELSLIHLVQCRFFLGIAWARLSDYGKARKLLGENLRCRHELTNSHYSLFYLYQGLAFYRFTCCRYQSAQWSIDRSFRAAVLSRDEWQLVLALDLKGYIYRMTGERAKAIAALESALDGAKKLGNGLVRHTLGLSLCIFRAEAGLLGTDVEKNLLAFTRKVSKKDNYSLAGLNLERSRHLSLRGQLKASQECLNKVCQVIYSSGHKRFRALLNFRYAYNACLRGDFHEALNLVSQSARDLDPTVDLGLAMSVRGLEREILEALGMPFPKDMTKDLIQDSLKTGSGMALRILCRKGMIPSTVTSPAEDPLGDLLDYVANPRVADSAKISKIVRSGYWAFLRNVVDIAPGEQGLYFDLLPNHLVIFDAGEIIVLERGVTTTIRAFVTAISQGPKTKEQLIDEVWGYRYHSQRHDHVIYTVASRIRQLLGERAHWLMSTEYGYELMAGSRVRFHQHLEETKGGASFREVTDPTPIETPEHARDHWPQDLNHRQVAILNELKACEFLGTNDCVEKFKVSKITAGRDLAGLVDHHLIVKFGKGRATRYRLASC